MFMEWTAIHGKTYDSDIEFARRFIRFKINLERVHRHNNAASSPSPRIAYPLTVSPTSTITSLLPGAR